MSTMTRFEKEAWGNSETAYLICLSGLKLVTYALQDKAKRGSARRVEISLVDTYFKTDACCVLGFVAHTCDLNSGAFWLSQ